MCVIIKTHKDKTKAEISHKECTSKKTCPLHHVAGEGLSDAESMYWLEVKQPGMRAPALDPFNNQGRKVRALVTVLGYEKRRVSLKARYS